MEAIVRSSNGDIYIDYETGAVKHIDTFKDGSLPDITKFELPGDKCVEYDILDLDFWLDNGRYIRARYKVRSELPIAPLNDDVVGPFFIKVLKAGRVVDLQNPAKGRHIIEYLQRTDYYGQQKMHYFTVMSPKANGGHKPVRWCDYESNHGYDRGPRRDALIRRMWYGKA